MASSTFSSASRSHGSTSCWKPPWSKAAASLIWHDSRRSWPNVPNWSAVGAEFSTREILTKELLLIRTVNAGIDTVSPDRQSRIEPPDRLGPDQRKALAHVLTSPDRFTGFRGLAGTGKSTVLGELARVLDNGDTSRCSALRPLPPPTRYARITYWQTMTLARLLLTEALSGAVPA